QFRIIRTDKQAAPSCDPGRDESALRVSSGVQEQSHEDRDEGEPRDRREGQTQLQRSGTRNHDSGRADEDTGNATHDSQSSEDEDDIPAGRKGSHYPAIGNREYKPAQSGNDQGNANLHEQRATPRR